MGLNTYKGLGQNTKKHFDQPRDSFSQRKVRTKAKAKRATNERQKQETREFIRTKYKTSGMDRIRSMAQILLLVGVLLLLYLITRSILNHYQFINEQKRATSHTELTVSQV